MIIEVRPTPTLRRHRARILGAVAGFLLALVTLVSVAVLAEGMNVAGNVTISDPVAR